MHADRRQAVCRTIGGGRGAGAVLYRSQGQNPEDRELEVRGGEIAVGQYAGFAVSVLIPTGASDGPCFVLKGRRAYAAHHSDNPQGMVRVIENVANGLEGRLSEVHEDLARAEKRLADILMELAKPFDKEERLTQLLVRQREINAALDLDKGNAGAMEAEAEAA